VAKLRNPIATRWDWDKFLEPYGPWAPRGISCADQDQETEINGHFLGMEGKRTGETLTVGQKRTSIARVLDNRTVFIVWGDPDEGTISRLEHFPNFKLVEEDNLWGVLHRWMKEWADWADKQEHPPQRLSNFKPS
jgi:hypothetical protein